MAIQLTKQKINTAEIGYSIGFSSIRMALINFQQEVGLALLQICEYQGHSPFIDWFKRNDMNCFFRQISQYCQI